MNKNKIGIWILVLLMFSVSVIAVPSQLMITDLDVSVDGKTDKNLEADETIDEEAAPGSEVTLTIEVYNNYTSTNDTKIEDIAVTATIDEIGDDEIEEESKEFDLDAEDDKRIKLSFKVPLEVEEDEYDIEIRAEGEDENGEDHSVTMIIHLEVDKDSHKLIITKAEIEEPTAECSDSVYLNLDVMNIGSNEEDAQITAYNSKLGLNFKKDVTLSEDYEDDDSKASERILIEVPEDAKEVSYPIEVKASYTNGVIQKTLDLDVACTVKETIKQPEVVEVKKEEQKEIPLTPIVTPVQITTAATAVQPLSLLEKYKYVFIVILANAIVLIAIIAVAAKAMRRRH